MKLKQALAVFHSEYASTLKSSHTVKRQMKPIIGRLGDKPLEELTTVDLARYRDSRLEEVSPQTVIHELGVITRALKYQQQEKGYVFKWGIPKTRNPKKPKGRDRRLKGDELERILSQLPDKRMRIFVLFAIETGMRRGEIIKSEWSDIDLERQTLHIPETKTGIPRTIPLSTKAVGLLRNVKSGWYSPDRPFPYVSADCATAAFWKAKRKAGIPDIRLHDLRHEAVSRFFELGLNVMEVSAISGHRDLANLKRYTHLRAEDLVSKLG